MTKHMYRTHHCNELRKTDIGGEVKLAGWVAKRRDHGGVIFIDLRDRYGLTQVVFDPKISKTAHEVGGALRSEYVIGCKGKVRARPPGMRNEKMPTGEVEVEGLELK